MLKKWRQRLSWRVVRRILGGVFFAILFYFCFLWHLGNLTAGMSPAEAAARTASSSIQAVAADPTYAPHKLLQLAVQSAGYHGAYRLRLVSVVFAVIFTGCLFYLLKAWFGKQTAFFGLIIFISTPLFILSSRSVAPTIMLASSLALLAAYVWLTRTERWPNAAWMVLCIVAAIVFYTPGVVWVLAAGLALGRKRLVGKTENISQSSLAAGVVLFFVMIAGAVFAALRHLSVAKHLLLIPDSLPGPLIFLKQTGWALSGLFFRTQYHFDLNIARLPLLTVVALILSVLGIYTLLKRAKSDATFLICLLAIGVVSIGLGQEISFSLFVLPVFGLAAAAGLRYLDFEWRSVFPRNPLPKLLAILLMVILVGLQLVYGVRYSLVAWPHTTETKTHYVLK